ncbi:CTTNBP2 N-terminal-like protein [Merluccius polli]|uniref:CTTNBP2 N-terminal-like protein n=1 Tax=Merluccius polli TaxID=89951 RepID=A0AA47M827_MERPO|nr:CTTNBP2 N-terminal-like protein [Merluccius polli]
MAGAGGGASSSHAAAAAAGGRRVAAERTASPLADCKSTYCVFVKEGDFGFGESTLNMETLSKPELLTLFSILEGELEARDLVIDALKAQRKELHIRERYGKYSLSDPFLALQRDSEVVGDQRRHLAGPSTSNPLVVLKLVVKHCRKMQDKMLAQLAAAESRHRRVIADLEEEKRRHAEDTAEGDDVTYILEKERERLQQQLEFERSQARRTEKEQRRLAEQLDEERAQSKQVTSALAKECKWASARALEDGHRLTEVGRKLEKEKEASQALQKELEEERRRALRMEARVEEQLAEFDTEREQLRSRLKKEEAHCCYLQQEVEKLRRKLEEVNSRGEPREECMGSTDGRRKEQHATKVPMANSRTETVTAEDTKEEEKQNVPSVQPEVNGHHNDQEVAGPLSLSGVAPDPSRPSGRLEEDCRSAVLVPHPTQSAVASSCGPPSPCSSPPPASRPPPGASPSPGSFQSSYQAGINQRFHAARHKFQGTVDPDLQPAASPVQASQPAALPASAKDPAPPAPSVSPEASPVKQLARSTVTQVLSRFTTAQQGAAAKPTAPNNSPFGTDYRHLAAPLSPVIGRAQGVRSPTVPRAERGNPPPIPPKKPGLAQAPASPAPVARSAALYSDSPISGSCGLTSSQEGVKELDMVVSSN